MWLGLAGLALLVVRLICAARMELIPQEAYYWVYSQHPDLGYFDHPPMVAWMVWIGTALLGKGEMAVRLCPVLLWLGSWWLQWLTARLWFGERAGWWTVVLFNFAPVFFAPSFFAMTEAPLIFFWMVTLHAITKAVQTQRTGWWLWAGVGVGCAMLSKYTAGILGASLMLWLLLSPRLRFWLLRPQPWLALAISVAVFSPVIIWNAQHQWASFLYHPSRTSEMQPHVLYHSLRFWLIQAGLCTPWLFALMAAAAVVAVRRGWFMRRENWSFAAAFSLPLLLFFAVESITVSVRPNWTVPAFLSLLPAAAAFWTERLGDPSEPVRRRWRLAGWIGGAASILAMIAQLIWLGWGFPRIPYGEAGGWRQLAREVSAAQAGLAQTTGQKPFVLDVDRYFIAAEMGFYTGQADECINDYALGSMGVGYRFWTDLRTLQGRPAIAVLTRPRRKDLALLASRFQRVGPPKPVEVSTHQHTIRTFYLVDCHGYSAQPVTKPLPPPAAP